MNISAPDPRPSSWKNSSRALALLAVLAAVLPLTAQPSAPPVVDPASTKGASSAESRATKDGKAVDLGKVEVRGEVLDETVLPVRPSSAVNGFDEAVKETPRSVFQLTKAQLDSDNITNYSDLSLYSPSIQKTSPSIYSTFANIRGGNTDTMRNGILLLNPEVRPFNNNAWESADIVAGSPSVVYGSTTRTAGYVNYVTKKVSFDGQHTELSATFGRLGTDNETTFGQFAAKVDTTGPLIADKLAYRLSVQKSDADTYWANSEGNFTDVYGALSWRPTSRLTIEGNFTYTDSDGPVPYGINRITQELIDDNIYSAGPATPIFKLGSTFYRPSLGGSGYDTGNVVNGLFQKTGTVASAPWTQANPADLQGWVTYAENTKKVKIQDDQTIYDAKSFAHSTEYIGQIIGSLALNDSITIRNNSLFQYSSDYRYGYDLYQSYMVNKLSANRTEVITDGSFQLFGKLINPQSNSGLDVRYLWNFCDNVGKPSERSFTAVDATQPGTLGTGYLFGANVLPESTQDTSLYNSVLTKYGYVKFAKSYDVPGEDRRAGVSVQSVGGSDLRINQLQTYSLFSEHKFSLGEQWSLHVGGRLTLIRDFLRASPTTYLVRDSGFFPANTNLADNAKANNGDYNVSLSYRPASWVTLYATYDHDLAGTDCGCCLTQGFTSPGNKITWSYFRTLSELYEAGAKFELVKGKLFATAAAFQQSRQVSSTISPSSPNYFPVQLLYNGAELSLTYQPTRALSAGVNYAYLHAAYDNQTRGSLESDYNGYVPDGVTLYTNSTGSNNPEASIRGDFRLNGIPLHTLNTFVSYQFASGFGVRANAWFTSEWRASRTAVVPWEYNLNAGVFYATKQWRLAIDLNNVTDQHNWSHGAGVAGDTTAYLLPALPFGVSGKVSYKF